VLETTTNDNDQRDRTQMETQANGKTTVAYLIAAAVGVVDAGDEIRRQRRVGIDRAVAFRVGSPIQSVIRTSVSIEISVGVGFVDQQSNRT
jgi:hypothetical protein